MHLKQALLILSVEKVHHNYGKLPHFEFDFHTVWDPTTVIKASHECLRICTSRINGSYD